MNSKVARKRKRRTMNLGAGVFSKLERMKQTEEGKLNLHLLWDDFMLRMIAELERRGE